jgi:hypothetical protein
LCGSEFLQQAVEPEARAPYQVDEFGLVHVCEPRSVFGSESACR